MKGVGGGGAYESVQECMNEHRGIQMSAGSTSERGGVQASAGGYEQGQGGTSEHGAAAGATCPRLSSLSPSHQFIYYYLLTI